MKNLLIAKQGELKKAREKVAEIEEGMEVVLRCVAMAEGKKIARGKKIRAIRGNVRVIFEFLRDSPGYSTPLDIYSNLGIPKSSVTSLLARAVKEGLLDREGRGWYKINEKGLSLLE